MGRFISRRFSSFSRFGRVHGFWLGGLLCVACWGPAAFADELAGRMMRWRQAYEKALAEVSTDYDLNGKILSEKYIQTLRQLLSETQAAGDLDAWARINQELERFATEGTLSPSDQSNAPQSLQTVQVQYVSSMTEMGQAKTRKILELSDQYLSRLDETLKSLTQQQKLDDATAVLEEVQRVNSDATVTSARFEVAQWKTTVQPVDAAAPADNAEPPGDVVPVIREIDGKVDNAKVTPVREESRVDMLRVAPRFTSPERKMSLRPTVAAGVTRNLSVQACIVESEIGTRWESGREVTDLSYVLKVFVRSAQSARKYSGTKVVAEFFVRRLGEGNLDESLKRVWVEHVALPVLTTEWVQVTCPAVVVRKSQWNEPKRKRKSGDEWYGVILSVQGKDGTLIEQLISATALENQAKVAVPKESVRPANHK